MTQNVEQIEPVNMCNAPVSVQEKTRITHKNAEVTNVFCVDEIAPQVTERIVEFVKLVPTQRIVDVPVS